MFSSCLHVIMEKEYLMNLSDLRLDLSAKKCPLIAILIVVPVLCIALFTTIIVIRGAPADVHVHMDELTWWQKSIVYQVYPRSFQDSDGDGTGDLRGIISRLPYLLDLGVGAVWLSPFYKSPMNDFGYDVSDYREVDPLFGTLQDFDDLIVTIHKLGLKLIVDFVPNHTSDQHAWFQLSRNRTGKYKDFYVWSDGTQLENGTREPPNNWVSVFGGSTWQWDEVRQQYYYHAFLKSQPDLNYRNPDVLEEMHNVLRYWLDKSVDGFRIDAIPYLFEERNLSQLVQSGDEDQHGDRFMMDQPEVYGVVKGWMTLLNEYKAKDGKVRWLLSEAFGIPEADRRKYYEAGSTPFNFDLVTVKNLCHNHHVDADCIRNIVKRGVNLTHGQWPNFVTGNHDNGRISDRIGPEFVDAMNMLLLTLPGTPTTYYGEEIGLRNGNYTGHRPKDTFAIVSGDWSNSRDPQRNPMQWNTSRNAGFTTGTPWLDITPNTDYEHFNVEVESKFENSTLGIYKNLAKLRQTSAFLNADISFPVEDHNALVYIRSGGSQQYLVVIHFGQNPYRFSFTQTDHRNGFVEAVTKGTFRRLHQKIDLGNISLRRGDGLVIRLL